MNEKTNEKMNEKTNDLRTIMNEVYKGMENPTCIRLHSKSAADSLANLIDALIEYGRMLLATDVDVEPPIRLGIEYGKFLMFGLKNLNSHARDQNRFDTLYYFVCRCAITMLCGDRSAEKQQKRLENAFMRQLCTDIAHHPNRGKQKPPNKESTRVKHDSIGLPEESGEVKAEKAKPKMLTVHRSPKIDNLMVKVRKKTPRRTPADHRAVMALATARSPCIRQLLPPSRDLIEQMHAKTSRTPRSVTTARRNPDVTAMDSIPPCPNEWEAQQNIDELETICLPKSLTSRLKQCAVLNDEAIEMTKTPVAEGHHRNTTLGVLRNTWAFTKRVKPGPVCHTGSARGNQTQGYIEVDRQMNASFEYIKA